MTWSVSFAPLLPLGLIAGLSACAALLVLFAEVWLLTKMLGKLFDRTEPSAIT